MSILKNGDIAKRNPIEVTDSDVDLANTEANIVDESEDEDNFTEVEWRCNAHALLRYESSRCRNFSDLIRRTECN